jgi:hypothetical protein
MARTALGLVAMGVAFVSVRINLGFAGRVELDGARARVRSLWLGTRQHDLRQLAEIHARPRPASASTGVEPTLEPATFDLVFVDRRHIFFSADDFPDVARCVEHAMRAPPEGFGFPVQLASACLFAWVRYPHDARMGCSGVYIFPDGGKLSLHAYRGDAETVPDGPDSREVDAELARAIEGVRAMAGRIPSAVLRELERGVVGEGGPLAMRMCTFAVGNVTEGVYLTGHGGRFLKGRFTGSASAGPAVARSLAALADTSALHNPALKR